MKINELIQRLEELARYAGEDVEVRAATQPSWPLQAYIEAVTLVGNTVFIATGSNPWSDPYAPREAWEGGNAGEVDEDEDEDED